MGRPTVITSDVLIKLEYAFGIGSSASEACAYAGICRDTFYDYIKNNPDFSDKITDLQANPLLKARKAVFDDLDNPKTAQWYLERKVPQEFNLPLLVEEVKDEIKREVVNRENHNDLTDTKTTKTILLTLLYGLSEMDDISYEQIKTALEMKRKEVNPQL